MLGAGVCSDSSYEGEREVRAKNESKSVKGVSRAGKGENEVSTKQLPGQVTRRKRKGKVAPRKGRTDRKKSIGVKEGESGNQLKSTYYTISKKQRGEDSL